MSSQKKLTEDILFSYDIILENKTPDKFRCEFLLNSGLEAFWSIDMKKTNNR